MHRSVQTDQELDRQPLHFLLAEEEFLQDMEVLSTDAQRQRRRELVGGLLADQRNAAWDRVQRGAMRLWEIAERERVACLPPPTTHRSIQRADADTASRRMTLQVQMNQFARDRQNREVLGDREAHVSAREAVENARWSESRRRRGELHDGGSCRLPGRGGRRV